MNYEEAYVYMESLDTRGRVNEPACIEELCKRLGNPENNVKFVHAQALKGVGAAFVASVLRCAGYRVGRYLPVEGLESREQIFVGRRPITKSAFCEGLELIREAYREMSGGFVSPSKKTVEPVLALWYFAREGCDFAVLENELLGLSEPLTVAEPGKISNVRYGLERQTFDYKGYKKLEISLAGKDQIAAGALAVEVIESLRAAGFAVSDKALYQGLRETVWPSGLSVVGKKPFFVVARGDSEEAAEELTEAIVLYFQKKRVIYICGMLQDADCEKIIRQTAGYADMILTVTPEHPRALHAFELAKAIAAQHPNVTAVDSLEEAVEMSCLLTGKEDVIIAFGTAVLRGRLTEILADKHSQKGGL